MKVEVVDGPIHEGTPSKPRYRTARADGHAFRVRVVSADSETFGADFGAAFGENVRRIRRDNRALTNGG